ncbi:immunomodulatory protein [Artomyces pyxidatus]|uniref:Immunomodulatory protein n=1 Tax=Artomyces pyxidatus TaxID=48021 RepID=A0ACB8T357_9AGAM|nr:immunomodulatory protein [Artomyces pyxidatus]
MSADQTQIAFDKTGVLLQVAAAVGKVDVDYTPQWKRGNPSSYIDSITFKKVLTDKEYQYRVVKGNDDLGFQPSYKVQPDGSQTVNLLEYNRGYGIADTIRIQIWVRDPATGNQYKIAQWN